MMSLATVVMMVAPPGEPRTSSGLPGLHCRLGPGRHCSGWTMMVGVMAESGRLPGAMALFGALDEAELVGHAGRGGEVVHLVVEQEAERAGGNARAEEIVERVGVGDGVALGIDDGEMGGLRGFMRGRRGRGRRRQEAGGALAAWPRARAATGSIDLRQAAA